MSDWHHVEVDDGYRMPLRKFEPESDAKAAFVFMPALGVRARYYQKFAESLASHGVHTTIMELRGQGESSLRASHRDDWGYKELALTDFPAAIAWAREQCPDVPVYIGGHSLGGQLAVVYMSQYAGSVDGAALIACSSPHYAYFPATQRRYVRVASVIAPILTRTLGYFPGKQLGFGGREARTQMDDWNQTAKYDRYHIKGVDADVEADIRRIESPVITLTMGDDTMAPLTAVEAIYSRLTSADHEHEIISSEELGAKADHFKWAKAPEAVTKRIAGWIDRR